MILNGVMFHYFLITLLFSILLFPLHTQAQTRTQKENDNVVNTKLERFFDINEDGWVSLYERGLMTTYHTFNWPLAKTKKMKKFDFNKNLMLEPFEYEQYLKWKKERKTDFKIIPTKQ